MGYYPSILKITPVIYSGVFGIALYLGLGVFQPS